MPRFGTRALLVSTAVAAYFVYLCRIGDWLPATIVVLAASASLWAIRSPRRGWWTAVRVGFLLVAAPSLWLAGLQGRWIIETCPDCQWESDSLEYRVLGVPIWADREIVKPSITRALEDLGFGCQHRYREGWIKHRYWGGCFCACPCINGVYGFLPGPFYTPEVSDRVRQIGLIDPSLAEELQRRVIRGEDDDYFWDSFMLDQYVLGAYDANRALEARRWLTEAPAQLKRELLKHNATWTPSHIDNLYRTGVSEVIIYWAPERYASSKPGDFAGNMVVRLPQEEPQRTRIISSISTQRIGEGDTGLIDYGQEFALAP